MDRNRCLINTLAQESPRAKTYIRFLRVSAYRSLTGAAAMHINTHNADRLALARALADKTPCIESGSDSAAGRVGLMPYIGVGTFLVAALLRSSLRPHKLPDSDRADPQP
jgi:hypothetical protein